MVYNAGISVTQHNGVAIVAQVSGINEYRITDHARFEMERRGISEAEISSVLATPEQVEMVRPGRAVFQSRLAYGGQGQLYLLRVFVDVDRRPAAVVTTYRTSRIERYWRQEP